MPTPRTLPFEAEIEQILSSRKYRHLGIPAETVRDLLEKERASGASPKEALKNAKHKLHNLMAPYLGDPDYPAAEAALQAAFAQPDPQAVRQVCWDLMSAHASTRERLPHLEGLYPQLWAVTGQPRVGFPVGELIQAIEKFLGWDNATDAFIIGAGHLGIALAGYKGFESKGLNVVALFDNDPRKIGQTIHGKEVLPIDKLGNLASRLHVHIAILTVPAEVAASVAQLAIDAGIQAIWNFTPTKLIVPEHVILERVDLAASLAVLSSKLAARLRPVEPAGQAQEAQA